MPIFHAIVLGLVQGLAEFLPISSSGHLLLVPWLFGWNDFAGDPQIEKAFDVALHLGTLVAVIGYFRQDLVVYVREGVRLVVKREKPVNPEGRLAWLLVLSSVPAAAVGAVGEKYIDEKLGTPVLIAISLIVFGVLLAWADRRAGTRPLADYTTKDALKVGAAQVLALNPGTSRSGITMTAARFMGFTRDAAARASFLMAIPVTTGAIAKIIMRAGELAELPLPVHPHMLRHSCGYYLAEQGLPTRDIQEYLGHKNIQHTVRYTAANPARFDRIQWQLIEES